MRVFVRPYESRDRAAVLQIAADTAFFGAPAEAFLDDRRIMQDAFHKKRDVTQARYHEMESQEP